MRLYEHEGKQLLRQYGIPTPRGHLWPDIDDGLRYPVVAKAQLFEGGRGKRGGIRFVDEDDELRSAVEAMLEGSPELPPAASVLVEQRLDIQSEYYLSLLMDREQKAPILLASAEGGVDIESVDEGKILRIPLDPLSGVPSEVSRRISDSFDLPHQQSSIASILASMWELFVKEDCLLLEINPLVLTADSGLLAADARLILDDLAHWRHPQWPQQREGTAFEQRCAQLGATATEMDGSIAVVTSGAGLGMATVDAVVALGGSVRCFVDLGGTVFGGSEALRDVTDAIRGLRPKVLLFNYYFQFARCDILAAGIAASYRLQAPECPVILRMRGNNAEEAIELVAPFNFSVTGDMLAACQEAVDASMSNADGYAKGAS